MVGSGVPNPRPDVAMKLSTPHGGHLARRILLSENVAELDDVLYAGRKQLRPSHIAAAAMQLEHLRR